ncbi:nitroreductase family deazaflavin-dependent oxidoreductase [Streptomyces sp. HNM0575]|uniref:nitroreductase family deazaflavin-dependent oxidoreductase n=1 Tax=Streptomyces sp. HNM0575 TaxID=2716338 RepID=UPI00145E5606|nr:nitroreductase family deazaflavin-dependent oxidoreductase [Streptomyces sp. HNM0575]NLU73835.1 nitroreductase family deazaflavin-dependent oxidoreductase [Streptomyces sp. HNM0575]
MPDRQTTPNRPPLPVGWRRLIARLPIVLFRWRAAWVFGNRLLLLHHKGRVTGLDRRVVLEVVECDPADGNWTIASGFGPTAAWYLNLQAEPRTTIQVGNRHHAVTAHFLPSEAGAEIMARNGRRHPRLARRLCAFMGLPADGTDAGFRTAGRAIPFVRLDADTDARLR